MEAHERLIKFKYQIKNLKEKVAEGNQLAIMNNGRLVKLANYDHDLGVIINADFERLEADVDRAIKSVLVR